MQSTSVDSICCLPKGLRLKENTSDGVGGHRQQNAALQWRLRKHSVLIKTSGSFCQMPMEARNSRAVCVDARKVFQTFVDCRIRASSQVFCDVQSSAHMFAFCRNSR